MFPHLITQIKCDHRYIGSVSHFSWMTDGVEIKLRLCFQRHTGQSSIPKARGAGGENRNLYILMVIKSWLIKHCQKTVFLNFNITVFSFFFLIFLCGTTKKFNGFTTRFLYNKVCILLSFVSLLCSCLKPSELNKKKTYEWNTSFVVAVNETGTDSMPCCMFTSRGAGGREGRGEKKCMALGRPMLPE